MIFLLEVVSKRITGVENELNLIGFLLSVCFDGINCYQSKNDWFLQVLKKIGGDCREIKNQHEYILTKR